MQRPHFFLPVVFLLAPLTAGCGVGALIASSLTAGDAGVSPSLDAGPDEPAVDAGRADGGSADGGGVDGGGADGGGVDGGDVPLLDAGPDGGGVCPLVGPPPTTDWWDVQWRQRRTVRFLASGVDEELASLPVLIEITPGGGPPMQSDDLRFVPRGGPDALAFELLPTSGPARVQAWVSVPLIAARRADTLVDVYWDNPCSTPAVSTAAQVWADYEAVLHFDEADPLWDSSEKTAPFHPGSPVVVEGVSGNAINFAGGPAVEISQLNQDAFPQMGLTVEAWVSGAPDFAAGGLLFGGGGADSANLVAGMGEPRDLLAMLRDPSGNDLLTVTHSVPEDAWQLVALTIEPPSTIQNARLYVSSQFPDRQSGQVPGGTFAPTGQIAMFGLGWVGDIDEVRISPFVRSTDWLRASARVLERRFVIVGEPPVPPPEPPAEAAVGSPVDGAVLRYLFNGQPLTGDDVPNVGTLMGNYDLNVRDGYPVPDDIGGGWAIREATTLLSDAGAGPLVTACLGSPDIVMEAWVYPDNDVIFGPARIFGFARGPSGQNFMIGQERGANGDAGYIVRMRTDSSIDATGRAANEDPILGPLGVNTNLITYVAFRWSATEQRMYGYIDGVPVLNVPWSGSGIDWDTGTDYDVVVGNEADDTRPWLGTIYSAALYCQEFTDEQVLTNYGAGPQ